MSFALFTTSQEAAAERALRMPDVFRLTRKEVERYSLSREIRRLLGGPGAFNDHKSFEQELTLSAFRSRHNSADRDPARTIVVPPQIFQRALATTPGSKGGFMVPPGVDSPLGVIDTLRPLSAAMRAGATPVSGLVSNVAAPRQTGTATVTWQAGEGTSITAADVALGQLSIAAKTVIAIVNFSAQLLVQAPRLLDMMLTRELASSIASELDKVALQGTGASGTPIGILNTPSVPTVTGTSLQVAGLISCQRKLLDNNGQSAPLGSAYITTPAVGELLAQRTNFLTGTAAPVWTGALAEGRILDVPAFATPNMAAASLIYGDFSRLLIAEFFDGVELSFQHASYNAGTIAARAMLTCDVAVEHPNAFVISTSIT